MKADEKKKILQYTVNGITKYYNKVTRSIIQQRSFAKAKILYSNKYRNKDGTLNFHTITSIDLRILESIDREFQKETSLYEEDGTKKEGISLRVAKELRIYLESIGKTLESEDKGDIAKFEKDRALAESQGSPYYDKWLSINATLGYETTAEASEKEVDVAKTTLNFKQDLPLLFHIIDSLEINLKYTKAEITDFVTHNIEGRLSEVYLTIQEGLLEKRKQLIKPYRTKGNYSEINGLDVQGNAELVSALYTIKTQLSLFRINYEGDTKVNYIANESYVKARLESINNPISRAKLENDARVVNGVPTAYHYRNYEVEGQRKVFQPSVSWISQQDTKENTSKVNPNYNEKLAGKTIQPKIGNKELDIFVNKEFHSLFGINKANDFWGEKGAKKNIGLYEVREVYLEEKEIVDGLMNNRNSYFKLPYVLGDVRDVKHKSIKGVVKGVLDRSFFVNDQDDEMVASDRNRKFIPKRYLQPEDADATKLTSDLSKMFHTYIEKGYDFDHKNSIHSKLLIL